jgi:hypothetical protein
MDALVSNIYPTSELATVDSNDPLDDLVSFSRKPSDSRFLSNDFVCLTPNQPLTKDITNLSFSVPRSVLPVYTSLNEIYIDMSVSLKKKSTASETATKPVPDTDNIAPVSFLSDVFWETVEIYFNDTLVSSSHKYRSIAAHLGRMLGYHGATFKAFAGTELGYVDKDHDADETKETNPSFLQRKSK